MERSFEFVVFDELAEKSKTHFLDFREATQARSKAATFCRTNGGPVDLAYAGDEPWGDRYITTAMPSEFHTSGVRFERLR